MKLTLLKRLGAAMAAVMVMGMVPAANVGAANTEFTYDENEKRLEMTGDNSPYFLKALVMDNTAKVPNVTFKYTIAPGTAQDAGNSTMQVYAGKGTPTIQDAVFSNTDPIYTTIQKKDSGVNVEISDDTNTVGTLENRKGYARKEVKVNFSGITFTKPGIYRYIVSETAPASGSVPGITNDEDTDRVLDVYVLDKDGKLVLGGCIFHKSANDATIEYTTTGTDGKITAASPADGAKSAGFKNVFSSYDLELKKTVTGNQASRAEYFKFVVKIEGAGKENEYNVDISNAVGSPKLSDNTTVTNPETIRTDGNGSVTQAFYLQHDQSIKIKDLPEGAKYTVIELGEKEADTATTSTFLNNEGYSTTIAKAQGGDVDVTLNGNTRTADDTTSGIKADTSLTYTNKKDGVVPTGIILTYTPYIIVGIIAAAAIILLAVRRRRSER